MRRLLIPFSGVWLTSATWAQDPAKGSAAAPEEIAARAMKAMDDDDAKPVKKAKSATEGQSFKADADEETGSGPALLPTAAVDNARGMDVLSRARLDMMVPTGRSHRGVHYPMYRPVQPDRAVLDPVLGGVAGVTAPLESLFESDVVTRLDEDHVQFDRAKWVQFDDNAAADGTAQTKMSLEIERGVYDLKNEILMTNQPVKIENRQFLIEGDTMLHDRATGLTRLTGRVKMTFYNEEPETASTPPVPATPAAPPAPTGVSSGSSKPSRQP